MILGNLTKSKNYVLHFRNIIQSTDSAAKYTPIGDARESSEIRDVRSEMLSRRRRAVLGSSRGNKGGEQAEKRTAEMRTRVGERKRARGLFCRRNWI